MRLVDADEIRKSAVPHTRGTYGYNADIRKWAVLVGDIDDAPTIDAVPVVRCKDCKYRREDEDYVCGHYCVKRPSNGGYFCEDNDFCSYGERKEGGDR